MANPLKILVVEDDRVVHYFLQRAFRLTRSDVEVSYVSDGWHAIGELAINLITGRLPDLVLLDLFLPRCTGFDVLEWMASHPILQRLHTVVFGSIIAAAEAKRAFALGACACVSKPTSPDEFLRLVESLPNYGSAPQRAASARR